MEITISTTHVVRRESYSELYTLVYSSKTTREVADPKVMKKLLRKLGSGDMGLEYSYFDELSEATNSDTVIPIFIVDGRECVLEGNHFEFVEDVIGDYESGGES